MKITTADCRDFLTTDSQVQQIVSDRSGLTDYNDGLIEEEVLHEWVVAGKRPRSWKRQSKYKIGSKTDMEGGSAGGGHQYAECVFTSAHLGFSPTGGTVRTFWLDDTDHVTVALLEHNSKLFFLEDLSD